MPDSMSASAACSSPSSSTRSDDKNTNGFVVPLFAYPCSLIIFGGTNVFLSVLIPSVLSPREGSTADPRTTKSANSDAASACRSLVWIQPTSPRVQTANEGARKTTSSVVVCCCRLVLSSLFRLSPLPYFLHSPAAQKRRRRFFVFNIEKVPDGEGGEEDEEK